MTIKSYYPPKLYRFLLELASENRLAIKEVETVFLRRQAEMLGFKCDHQNIGYSKKTKNPYCKDCWTRLKQIKPPVMVRSKAVQPGEFKALETFLETKEVQL